MNFKDYPIGWNLINHDGELLERNGEPWYSCSPMANINSQGIARILMGARMGSITGVTQVFVRKVLTS